MAKKHRLYPSPGHPATRPALIQCENHDYETIWYWNHLDECPACVHVRETRAKSRDKNAKIRQLKLELKVAKQELVEERMLHNSTKLDAAEYLAQKRLVNKLVKDRMK